MSLGRILCAACGSLLMLGLLLPGEANSAEPGLSDLSIVEIEAIAREAYDAGELDEAILFWNAAANRGSVTAMVSLAAAYEESSVSNATAMAKKWYRAAARHGDVIAMVSLADILLDQSPRNRIEARVLLRRAAEAGNAYAIDRLRSIDASPSTF
ncbi:MAG: hypothetical protein AAGL24_24400 [Pseudomonadota bacterium]